MKRILTGIAASIICCSPAVADLVATESVMFGDVEIGSFHRASIRVLNSSTSDTIIIESIEISGNNNEFGLGNLCVPPVTLSPHTGCIINVELVPLHYGAKKRKLNIDGYMVLPDGTTSDVSLTIQLLGNAPNPNKP